MATAASTPSISLTVLTWHSMHVSSWTCLQQCRQVLDANVSPLVSLMKHEWELIVRSVLQVQTIG